MLLCRWLLVLKTTMSVGTPWAVERPLDWTIEKELERSIAAFGQKDGRRYLERLSAAKYDKSRIIIRDGRVVVHKDYLQDLKKKAHLNVLVSALAFGYTLPNVIYLHEGTSSGMLKESPDPTTVIAKKYGYEQPGILVPNCYFGGNGRVYDRWVSVMDKVKAHREKYREWNERDPRVFWRGEIIWTGNNSKGCDRLSGQFARMDAISLTTTALKDFFDVRCNRECSVATKITCDDFFHFDDTIRKFIDHPDVGIDSHFYSTHEYAKYQFLLNLPGKTMGSYSRNLNHLWFTGAVILLWDANFVEFYYPALHSGSHFLAINKSTAVDAVRAVKQNDTLRQTLIANAKRVGDDIVCPRCIASYMHTVLHKIRHHFHLAHILDDKNSSDAFYRSAVPCNRSRRRRLRIGSPTLSNFVEIVFRNGSNTASDLVKGKEKSIKERPISCQDWLAWSSLSSAELEARSMHDLHSDDDDDDDDVLRVELL